MKKIFEASLRRLIDTYTVSNDGITSFELMENAAWQCSLWLMQNYTNKQRIFIFAGKGNNGGDGLAIARQLLIHNYDIKVYLLYSYEQLSIDAKQNYERLKNIKPNSICLIESINCLPDFNSEDIIVDAILGSGLDRPLDGFIAELVEYLNRIDAIKISIDIPSGLSDKGVHLNQVVFKANFTLTFEFPYLSFLFPENYEFVGKYIVLNIGLNYSFIQSLSTPYKIIDKSDIQLKPRNPFGYKNQFGHALLLAGSKGMMGAAILSSRACLTAGCGLVTTHVPSNYAALLHFSIPEVIVSSDSSSDYISSLIELKKYSAIAIGPGIGTNNSTHQVLYNLLNEANVPVVIDADGINILSSHPDWCALLKANTIITPHPGEFDRLFGKTLQSDERIEKQLTLAQKYNIIIILKGRYTSIGTPDGICYFNTTGNHGMATAGSGDVLTGIILSFLAQGYHPLQASILSVFLHGLAGDYAAQKKGYHALIASDIIENLCEAFKDFNYEK